MILGKNKRLFKRIISFSIAFLMIMGLVLTQNIFALNSISGKASNFSGYRILDDHTIEFWVDKGGGITPEASQLKIWKGTENSGNQIPIINVTNGSARNVSGIIGKIPQGQSYILTIPSASFKSGETYTLAINNTVSAGSNTLGWFTSHKDISFSFSIPQSNSTPNTNSNYLSSTTPISNSWPENNAANVAVESNIWISTSVPVDNYNEVKAGLLLKKNGVPVKYDNYLYTGTVTNGNNDAGIFSPVVTDDHTFFYFPLTVGGKDTSIYNLQADSQYELLVPEMKMINGQTIPKHSINFHTASSTVATQFASNSSVSSSGDNLQINWNESQESKNISPAPSAYNVYASTDKYWNYVKLNTAPITGTSFVASNCGLLPNTTYYFRVSALSNKNILTGESGDVIESGFSNAIEGKISSNTNDTGNQTGGNSGGNTGSQTGGNPENQTGGNTKTGGNTNTNAGSETGVNAGGNTGGQAGENAQTVGSTGTNTGSESGVNNGVQSSGNETESKVNNGMLALSGNTSTTSNTASQSSTGENVISNSGENITGSAAQGNENTSSNDDTISAKKVDDNKNGSDAKTSKKSSSNNKESKNTSVKESLLGKMNPISWIAVIISLVLIYRIVFVILKSRKKVNKK